MKKFLFLYYFIFILFSTFKTVFKTSVRTTLRHKGEDKVQTGSRKWRQRQRAKFKLVEQNIPTEAGRPLTILGLFFTKTQVNVQFPFC